MQMEFKRKYLIQFLIFFSIAFLFAGCSFARYGNLKKIDERKLYKNEIIPFSVNNEKNSLFKAKIELNRHYFSGLLFIKKLKDFNYRIVFIAEVGMKIFDFEILHDSFTVHYCIERFRKNYILKILEKDLKMILMNDLLTNKKVIVYKKATEDYNVYSYKDNDGDTNYYFFNVLTKNIYRIENASSVLKNIIIIFSNYEDLSPKKIHISHCNIPLELEFNRIKGIDNAER